MKIYHIEFAKIGYGMSGGEMCMTEMIRSYINMGIQNVLCTTDNGKVTYEKLGLIEGKYLKYKIIHSYKNEKKYHLFISYLLRTFQAVRLINKIKLTKSDVIICHSEFFPNSIATYFLERKNTQSSIIYFYHMIMPRLFYGYAGHFTNKIHLPNLSFLHHKLNQILYRYLIHIRGVVVTVNPAYEEEIKKLFPHNKTHVIQSFGGGRTAHNKKHYEKKYDYLWLGRLAKVKGIDDLLVFISEMKRKNMNKKLMIIGSGHEKEVSSFKRKLQDLKVDDFVSFRSNLFGDEKEKVMSQSKVFLMTSYYESYGLVILEALGYGIPVIVYDLPIYTVFKKGIIRVPIGSVTSMIRESEKILMNKKIYSNLSNDAKTFAKSKSWKKTAKEVLAQI